MPPEPSTVIRDGSDVPTPGGPPLAALDRGWCQRCATRTEHWRELCPTFDGRINVRYYVSDARPGRGRGGSDPPCPALARLRTHRGPGDRPPRARNVATIGAGPAESGR